MFNKAEKGALHRKDNNKVQISKVQREQKKKKNNKYQTSLAIIKKMYSNSLLLTPNILLPPLELLLLIRKLFDFIFTPLHPCP